jgi:hypothetical protein
MTRVTRRAVMQNSDDRQADVRAEFSRRRRNQLVLAVPVLMAIFLMTAVEDSQAAYGIPAALLKPAAIVIVVGAIAYSLYNWRCPACSRYLGRWINPRYCVRCGAQLRE